MHDIGMIEASHRSKRLNKSLTLRAPRARLVVANEEFHHIVDIETRVDAFENCRIARIVEDFFDVITIEQCTAYRRNVLHLWIRFKLTCTSHLIAFWSPRTPNMPQKTARI